MDLQFVISAQEAGSALQVENAADRAILAGLASGRRIVFEGVFSNVTVKVSPVEDQPVPVSPAQPVPPEPVAAAPVAVKTEDTEQLFDRLVALRKKISSEVKMPPFIIFHDSTLRDMCRKLPVDLETMGTVSGVGEAKLAKFGARFVEVIREYLQGKEG